MLSPTVARKSPWTKDPDGVARELLRNTPSETSSTTGTVEHVATPVLQAVQPRFSDPNRLQKMDVKYFVNSDSTSEHSDSTSEHSDSGDDEEGLQRSFRLTPTVHKGEHSGRMTRAEIRAESTSNKIRKVYRELSPASRTKFDLENKGLNGQELLQQLKKLRKTNR